MSPPTSPNAVMVDKISVRRKSDINISAVATDRDFEGTSQDNSKDNFFNNTNKTYNQTLRFGSKDTYKRIV